MVACCLSDGSLKTFHSIQGKSISMTQVTKQKGVPATTLRWHTKSQQTIVCTTADGILSWVHYKKGNILAKTKLTGPSYCLDISHDGNWLVAGAQKQVNLIDDNTQKIIKVYKEGVQDNYFRGHTNRIFSIKVIDQNIFISGGWDSSVKIWDRRTHQTSLSIKGPNLSGDALDYKDGKVLTGSYRNQEVLQLWDLKTQQKIKEYTWSIKQHQSVYCYSCQFGKCKKASQLIAAGTAGHNLVKLFNQQSGQQFASITMQGNCFGIDFGNASNMFACSGAQGLIYIFSII